MTRRDKERKESLAFLGRIAESVSQPVVPPKPSPSVPSAPRAPLPPPRRPPAAAKAPPRPAARAPAPAPPPRPRDPLEGRKAKLEEQRLLRERRERELTRSKNLEWRGGGFTDIPASIRRTGFDRAEPSLQSKIEDVLGTPLEKEGRAKNRDKGKRQGGK